MKHTLPAVLLLLLATGTLLADTDQPVDYLRDVKPILADRCFACHGALKQEAGLRLDTAALVRQGGDSGAVVDPDEPPASLLLERVRDPDPSSRMPPESEGAPLKAEEIAKLEAWIAQGAPGPENEEPEQDPSEHWAFQKPTRPHVPMPRDPSWVLNPIDAFIAQQRDERGLAPQPPADKRVLLRRVYIDLIGVPPTLDEIEAFLADDSPQAYETVVARLLDSPEYGERWGRHWMDIWRYSDWWGLGGEVRNSQKHIWHWRDWIVECLNTDVGYDEMCRQMLAADELYPNELDKLRATGFLARHYFKFNRNTWLDDTIEHTAKAFLGLTMNCAKCHDHKYDPIGQEDYYRLRAFFEPYQIRIEQVPGETDYEQDGIPRVFDCNLDAPTYLFTRGNEKQPETDRPLAPGIPSLLEFTSLEIQPITLPPEAQQPGLRPWVLENHLQKAEREKAAAEAAVAAATMKLAEAEAITVASAEQPQDGAPADTDADADAEKKIALARTELHVAQRARAIAERKPSVLRARAAADQAVAGRLSEKSTDEYKREAARLERELAALQAAEALARAELELLKAEPAKRGEFEQKVAAAREACEKAEQAAGEPSDAYTPLDGALKTVESPTETEESRRKPFPAVSSGRRTALARWITDPQNPLTARVAVNHIWTRHFNAPLVPTVFDFGRKGLPPTHPELLDWLACEFMEHGWSMKHLHRLIVTSNTYRMTSSAAGAEAQAALDPENRAYWRMNPTRMEAQVVRDALLHLSGELAPQLGGPPVPLAEATSSRRRSMYFVHSHNEHHPFLEIFDDARVLECYRREQSIVPQQALALANSRQALEASEKIAARITAGGGVANDDDFIRQAFRLLLAAEPNDAELQACRDALAQWLALDDGSDADERQQRARVSLVHALVNHNDFITIR